MAEILRDVSELYVAILGRPAEPAGGQFWDDFFRSQERAGRSVDDIDQEMAARFADSDEARDLYSFLADPAQGDPLVLINEVYQHLFNRDAEEAGRLFWEQRFEELQASGVSVERAVSQFVVEVWNAASGDDRAAADNKVTLANEYTNQLSAAGATFDTESDLQAARDLLASVSADAQSLADALAQLEALLNPDGDSGGGTGDGGDGGTGGGDGGTGGGGTGDGGTGDDGTGGGDGGTGGGGTPLVVDLTGLAAFSAQDGVAEIFVYEFDSSSGSSLSSDAQLDISNFNPDEDLLRFVDEADPVISDGDFLGGATTGGAIITVDAFGGRTVINFGDDPTDPGDTPGFVGLSDVFEGVDLATDSRQFFEIVGDGDTGGGTGGGDDGDDTGGGDSGGDGGTGGGGGEPVTVDLSGASDVTAQSGVAEIFTFTFDSSSGSSLSSDANAVIAGFDPAEDLLRFDDLADPALSASDFVAGPAAGGPVITQDAFAGGTFVNFGDDPALAGDAPGSVGLLGLFEPDLANASGAFFEVI